MRAHIKLGIPFSFLILFWTSSFLQIKKDRVYEVPDKIHDGWTVSSLAKEGLKTDEITNFASRILNGEFSGIRSFLIIKNGRLVFEDYFGGSKRDDLFTVFSVSKSVTSALIGIAIDKGFIKSTDATVAEYFPEYEEVFRNTQKSRMTLSQLLTLTSGVDWDEGTYSYEDSRNIHVQMESTQNWIRFILNRPMKDVPGTKWLYNTGNVQLLSAIVRKATGIHLNKFAEKYLFEPLGITEYSWNSDPQGYTCAGGSDGGLRIRARDLAKIGSLYLNQGRWSGKDILSREWIELSLKRHVSIRGNAGYGYLWWATQVRQGDKLFDVFYATGFGGHRIYLIPGLNMQIVQNSSGENSFEPLKIIVGKGDGLDQQSSTVRR